MCWCDDNNVYVEIPVAGEAPYITSWPLTEAGFSKALGIMRDARRKQAITHGGSTRVKFDRHPIVKPKEEYTNAQRSKTLELLKKRGLVR
jgi:hypothetical protein